MKLRIVSLNFLSTFSSFVPDEIFQFPTYYAVPHWSSSRRCTFTKKSRYYLMKVPRPKYMLVFRYLFLLGAHHYFRILFDLMRPKSNCFFVCESHVLFIFDQVPCYKTHIDTLVFNIIFRTTCTLHFRYFVQSNSDPTKKSRITQCRNY